MASEETPRGHLSRRRFLQGTTRWVYYRKGFIDTAYPLISEAVKKSGKNPVIRYHHGMVLGGMGRKKEAEAEIKAALSLAQKFPGRDEAIKAMDSWK